MSNFAVNAKNDPKAGAEELSRVIDDAPVEAK